MSRIPPETESDSYRRDGYPEGYAVNAQYYEMIFPSAFRDSVVRALQVFIPGSSRVVEIGSGTGLFTAIALDLLPVEAELFAIEPSPVMRAALTSRIAGRPADARRLTLLPHDALTARLPNDVETIDALLLLHVLTHLSPEDRRAVWRLWVARLRPGGVLLADTQWPQQVESVPPTTMQGSALGRHRFETLARAEPLDEGRVTWTMSYRRYEGDRLLSEDEVSFPSYVVGDGTLDEELAEVGCLRCPSPVGGIRAWRKS